ncbi:MAG: thiamine diphosphokinase [Geminicoccaceae bacterium]
MSETPLLRAETTLLLIGGAPLDATLMKRLAANRPLVAADSGANTALRAGLAPDLVLGDLDSIEEVEAVRQRAMVVHLTDQNSTDLEKALASVEAPAIIGLGFLGARFDHSLAALHALTACTKSREIMLIGEHDLVLRVRGDFRCALPEGLRFSVWPLVRQEFHRSSGLRYPLDDLSMQSGELIGISNETIARRVVIEPLDGPGYLVIMPIEVIDAVLASRPDSWL